jgi:hypothetical protein
MTGGEKNGKSVYTNMNGHTYIGEWKDGNPHGKGTEITAWGSTFAGNFKGGLWSSGVVTFPDGTWYKGALKFGGPRRGFGGHFHRRYVRTGRVCQVTYLPN